MKKKLRKYLKKRLKRIVRYLKLYADAPDHQILHKLRLEIKKVRAVLRMLRDTNDKFKYGKIYAPLKEIFKVCGAIRDPHVMRTLSEKYTGDVFPPVTENPKRILDFTENIPDCIRKVRKVKRPILREANKMKSNAYRRYVKAKKRKLKKRLYPHLKKKQLHGTRRRIKDIGYLLGIVKKKKMIDPFYDNAGDIIGDWHDKQVLLGRINEAGDSKPELRVELVKKSKEDLKKLHRELKAFYR